MTADTFKFQVPPDWASREEIIGALELWVRRAKSAEAREKELREALRKFAGHKLHGCESRFRDFNGKVWVARACTCGWAEAEKLLAGEPETKEG